MRNRRLLWCLGAGVLLLAAGAVLWVFVHVLPDRVTPENVERIQVGETTEGEVRALLGGPPDIEVRGSAGTLGVHTAPNPAWEKMWIGERWGPTSSSTPAGGYSPESAPMRGEGHGNTSACPS